MLITNAAKLCTDRGFHGRVESVGYGYYAFVISTATGRYCLPVSRRIGSDLDAGQVNEYVIEAILLHDKPAASPRMKDCREG
jgi:hypothetical protein